MSWNDAARWALIATLGIVCRAPLRAQQETPQLTCPAETKGHKFLRPSIYNGHAGKEEYELAPDDERKKGTQITQIWKLSDYQDSDMFVRCRYAGTSITVVKELPVELKTCTFRFRNVAGDQPVAAPSFVCK